MREVVIVAAVRTPVGNFGGSLKDVAAADLGAVVLKAALIKAGVRPLAPSGAKDLGPDGISAREPLPLEREHYDYDDSLLPVAVDEVILGNVVGAGQGQNLARQAMIKAGIPKETPAYVVNKVCASGMKAVALGAQAITAGGADVVLAGGVENMSRIPYALPSGRWGARLNDTPLVDLLVFDGLFEIFYGYHMGVTAENIAAAYGISRQEQDELGALSHARARAAIAAGRFSAETVPVLVPQRRGEPVAFTIDERPMETSVEKMARLQPAFKEDGTVTAGNSSGINDGAAALLLMAADAAKELGVEALATIRAATTAGVDPAYMGLGPIPAVRRLLQEEKLAISDFGAVELNEAFAVQAIACMRELGCGLERTNRLGSGISIGHPIGCTGARILVTLAHQMVQDDLELGLATLCIGGGMGMAMALQR